MFKLILLFIITLLTFLTLDFIWFHAASQHFYTGMDKLLRYENGQFKPILWSALLVYLLMVVGVLVFVLPRAQHSILLGFFYGVLFGLITYGVYDFTSYSILENWSLNLTLIDVAWGIVACSLTSAVAVFAENKLS